MAAALLRSLWCISLILALQVSAFSQTSAPRAEPVVPSGGSGIRPSMLIDPDRKLQPGDVLSLVIVQDNEPGPQVRQVSAAGHLEISPLGSVKVAGMTIAQATGAVKRFLEEDYYYEATVRLSVDQANVAASMGTIYLSGQVGAVGAQAIYADRPLFLSQAILNAGGFKRFADSRKVKVTREVAGRPKTYVVDVKEIIEKGRTSGDMPLQDGDRIFVPESFLKY
ncbi:MAG: polysaccharide biosynthesis/export family protein [Chthoniobacteraceae bacterium]